MSCMCQASRHVAEVVILFLKNVVTTYDHSKLHCHQVFLVAKVSTSLVFYAMASLNLDFRI